MNSAGRKREREREREVMLELLCEASLQALNFYTPEIKNQRKQADRNGHNEWRYPRAKREKAKLSRWQKLKHIDQKARARCVRSFIWAHSSHRVFVSLWQCVCGVGGWGRQGTYKKNVRNLEKCHPRACCHSRILQNYLKMHKCIKLHIHTAHTHKCVNIYF